MQAPQKVETLSEVDIAEDAPVIEALPEIVENENRRGFFSGLFRGQKTVGDISVSEVEETPEKVKRTAEPATADADVPAKQEDQEGQETQTKRKGFWSFARSKNAEEPAPEKLAETESGAEIKAEAEAVTAAEVQSNSDIVAAAPVKPKRKGIFGFARRQQEDAEEADDADAVAAKPEVVVASLQMEDAKPRKRKGFSLFQKSTKPADPTEDGGSSVVKALTGAQEAPASGRKKKRRRRVNGPDKRDVPFGTQVPFGEIVRVCDAPKRKLGKRILKASGYAIYDSQPTSTNLHAFYLTGFDDGCVRQLTAALVIFGSAGMHEMIRYGLPSETQPYSNTDKSYEKIKRVYCGVGRKKPCGDKVKLLEKNTVFVSYYARYKYNSTWSNILLHDGWVVAADSKSGGKS